MTTKKQVCQYIRSRMKDRADKEGWTAAMIEGSDETVKELFKFYGVVYPGD